MFGQSQIWYVLYYGEHENDIFGDSQEFRSLSQAKRALQKSTHAWGRIDKWTGDYETRDGDYAETIMEVR